MNSIITVKKKEAHKVRSILKQGYTHVFLLFLGLIWIIPSFGLFVTSWRSRAEIAASGWWTAFGRGKFTVSNYAEVFLAQGFFHNFINSIIITIPSVIFPILIAGFAAYAFECLRFKGGNALFLAIIALLVIPLQTTWVPVLRMYRFLNLSGSWLTIWLAHTAYGLPFAIFLLKNFFADIPKDLFSSAKIDGCSNLGILFRIVLPISTPAIASLGIFQFVWTWNDLMNALVFLADPKKYPLTVAIQNLLGQYGSEWNLLSAGAFIAMFIPLMVFFSLQRFFVKGITAGSIKG
ncbi:MAG: carbohydrate ABC transporter permease [Spirochaetes bacterium]|nr:carbohydrate ABC transporter permease [Spirochaetota bacterium]